MPVAPAENVARDLVVHTPAFEDALDAAKSFARASKAQRTVQAYRSAFRSFTTWCESVAEAHLPATPETVAAYLSALATSGRKAATIDSHAAAIAFAHRAARHEPPTSSELVRATIQGIRRSIGTKPTRKAPATAEALKKILKKIPDTLVGQRDRALLLIGFAAALRRSELVALAVADLERTPEGIIVHIGKSKTDQEGAGQSVPIPMGGKLKAVQALDAWLQAAGITAGPIFRPVAKRGRVGAEALTDRSVAQIVKDRAEAAGLDPAFFAGHSLRAGFVTSALAAGADVLKVMDVTRHTSVETLKRYDRRAQAFKDHAGKGFL
ncbi:hypothetical protein GCM10007885_27170 [Methylobacterium gnaphalii]|nr:hypothetical protein GCM10007885_27170 [Methylobacterium gnaphalii]